MFLIVFVHHFAEKKGFRAVFVPRQQARLLRPHASTKRNRCKRHVTNQKKTNTFPRKQTRVVVIQLIASCFFHCFFEFPRGETPTGNSPPFFAAPSSSSTSTTGSNTAAVGQSRRAAWTGQKFHTIFCFNMFQLPNIGLNIHLFCI